MINPEIMKYRLILTQKILEIELKFLNKMFFKVKFLDSYCYMYIWYLYLCNKQLA